MTAREYMEHGMDVYESEIERLEERVEDDRKTIERLRAENEDLRDEIAAMQERPVQEM